MRGIQATSKQGENVFLYKDYHALVVGVSQYDDWPDLPNAAKDAQEVAKRLEELGFTVKLAIDPTSQEMRLLLNELIYDIGKESDLAVLFYYAGHGETETLADDTKMGYIIPKDCPLLKQDPKGFGIQAISMREIEAVSLRIRAKHVLMLFDSCFSGSLFSLVRAVPDDISEKSTLPVRQYITAGREEEQVPDRSMFKRCFLIGLEGDADLTGDGYITGSEMGLYLSEKVVNYTRRRQHPQYGKINNPNLDRGDFIFVPVHDRDKNEAADVEFSQPGHDTKKEQISPKSPTLSKKSQIASLPKESGTEAVIRRVKLRETPGRIDERDMKSVVYGHGFFVRKWNERGDFANDFVDNGDGSVTDRATGLRWLRDGSPEPGIYSKAKEFLSDLNKNGFLGYRDWRIPTVEELCSLLEPRKNHKGQHIDDFFNEDQPICWTSDQASTWVGSKFYTQYFAVDFQKAEIISGYAKQQTKTFKDFAGGREDRYFVRAVRSSKELSAEKSPDLQKQAAVAPQSQQRTMRRVRLRSEPGSIGLVEIKEMVGNYNFFIRGINERGVFPNEFGDNDDGSITDRATGLMWLQKRPSDELRWRQVDDFISEINEKRELGYGDWRIPTLEELCSLLVSAKNDNGEHIHPFFEGVQGRYWSSDFDKGCYIYSNHTVDFSTGEVQPGITSGERFVDNRPMGVLEEKCFLMPVRTVE
jgi:hypothetical protein